MMGFKKGSAEENLNAYLGPDLTIEGDLTFKGVVRFEGRLKGKLQGNKIIIGDTAQVEGDIQAQEVVSAGKIKGQLQAQVVHFQKTAVFHGDLQAERISVEEGAQLEGQFKVSPQTPPSKGGKAKS